MTRIAAVTSGFVVFALSLPARAQDAAQIEADRRFREGVRLFQEEEYADALREFEASRNYRETASVTYNIANCLKALGRRVEAIAAYRRFLVIKAERLTPAERSETESIIADLLPRVAELRVRTEPPGAEVLVNGRAMPEPPVLFDVGTEIAVEARKDGYRPARTSTRLTSPGPFELSLTLDRAAGGLDASGAGAAGGDDDGDGAPEGALEPTGDEPSEESGGSALPWILAGAAVVAIGAGVGIFLLTRESPPRAEWTLTTP